MHGGERNRFATSWREDGERGGRIRRRSRRSRRDGRVGKRDGLQSVLQAVSHRLHKLKYRELTLAADSEAIARSHSSGVSASVTQFSSRTLTPPRPSTTLPPQTSFAALHGPLLPFLQFSRSCASARGVQTEKSGSGLPSEGWRKSETGESAG